MRHNAGFTLVELMVVVAIVAIMAVLAAPAIGRTLANQQVKQATFELAQTLQVARSNAILYRRAIIVRSTYNNTATSNWNGAVSGTPYQTDVTTSDQSKIANTSWYILETGSAVSSVGAGNNRVSSVSTVSSDADVSNSSSIAIKFLPDSSVEIQAVKDGSFVASTATQIFKVCSKNSSARLLTGREVYLNRFGNVTVSEKSTGVCT